MEIKNLGNLSISQVQQQVAQGAKFVIFEYTVSIVVMTFKKPTDIYFIPPGEGTAKHSWGFSVLTLVMGWWGFPWGPIHSFMTFATNFGGGKDVTKEIMHQFAISQSENMPTNTNSYGINNSGNTDNSGNTNTNSYNIPR